MATATKKPHAASPSPSNHSANGGIFSKLLNAIDAIYRFLASLKLAVISLGSLAFILAYATFFERWYGTAAVQEWIYRSSGFAIVLAFLGANILCAALIRFPWKKRQTGFVITHAGLLILLGGSWWSMKTADEGQVPALEGEVKDELIRTDDPVIRIQQIDAHNPREVLHEWELPFKPGAFGWGPGQPKANWWLTGLLTPILGEEKNPEVVLTRPKDPFQLVVKSHIPASVDAKLHLADPSGSPMAKIRPKFKPPGMAKAMDVFESDDDRWFTSDRRLFRIAKNRSSNGQPMPATIAFMYVDKPELVEDFLNPPEKAGNEGVARFHYTDKSGKAKSYDWALDGQSGKTVTLPESDLSVKFLDVVGFPAREAGLSETLGESTIPIAQFEISKAGAAPIKHFGLASLPMFPNLVPQEGQAPGALPKPLAAINYHMPPVVDPKVNGRFGMIEVLGTPEGKLYYRAFGRGENGQSRSQIRNKGELVKGKEIVAFGGTPNVPMTISFDVEEYFTAGIEKPICEPIVLPRSAMGNGVAASLVEMTVKDTEHGGNEITKEFYVRRSASYEPVWQTQFFGENVYRISYDVDRRPLGFSLKFDKIHSDKDPGTNQPATYMSKVRLTDKVQGINDKAITISMNEPLKHRGYTFYQSGFQVLKDAEGNSTGVKQSVLQVGVDPGRMAKYFGCALVVFGAFVQFYMRAGIFTDGGNSSRQTAASKSLAKPSTNGHTTPSPTEIGEPKAAQKKFIEEEL